jgi:tRNA A-37 threonylcarbamoyl transferase component Bud32
VVCIKVKFVPGKASGRNFPRGIPWKVTTVGKFTVEHWARLDPKGLLESLDEPPQRIIGFSPMVHKHSFGPHELAVRWTPPLHGRRIFDTLKIMAEDRKSLIETPVAFITPKSGKTPGRVRVVTLWKKGTQPFSDFVEDPSISPQKKVDAALAAVRELARLNAAGFTHGHFGPKNLLVSRNGIPSMVDCSLVGKADRRRPVWPSKLNADALEELDAGLYLLAYELAINGAARDPKKFQKRLYRAYEQAFKQYKPAR